MHTAHRSAPQVATGVVGLGQIGGSIAKALKAHGESVCGYDTNAEARQLARADGISVVSLDELVGQSSLIVVAVPMSAYVDVCTAIARLGPLKDKVVIDVGSASAPMRSARTLLEGTGAELIGTHPMAGREHHGFANAAVDLFKGTAWFVLLDAETSAHGVATVATMGLRLGAGVIPTSAACHDALVARVSHLSHVVSAVLARACSETPLRDLALRVAGGSFRDGTRVMSSDPAFVASLCTYNAEALVPLIDTAIDELTAVAEALRDGHAPKVQEYFAVAHGVRLDYLRRRVARSTSVILDAEGNWQPALLGLAEQGFQIVGLEHRDGRMVARLRSR